MNIVLSGVGDRPYLARWFREALTASGLNGALIVTDQDSSSLARAYADEFLHAPYVTDPAYPQWLQACLSDHDVRLAVSGDDAELSTWAQLPTSPEWDPLVRLTPDDQRLVEDKYAMTMVFGAQGMNVPPTWLGGAVGRVAAHAHDGEEFVVKGRFSKTSRELRLTDTTELADVVLDITREVTDRQGRPARLQRDIDPRELVIIQKRITGPEYGLDVICDLDKTYAGVLARRKITLRAGATERAETVAPGTLDEVARRVAEAVPHAGAMEVDVMVDADGVPYVIDVNPRLGSDYPFSHLAGARLPDVYVAWAAGLAIDATWLTSDIGVVVGKYTEAVRIS